MGVYIRGMEMPTNCADCRLRMAVGCCGNLPHNTRMPNCPLVPVPPHGRLIDADKLMLKIWDYIAEYGETDERGWHTDKWCAMKETEMAINDAPTIIEAEEGE